MGACTTSWALSAVILSFKPSTGTVMLEIRIRSVGLVHVHSVGVVWYAWK